MPVAFVEFKPQVGIIRPGQNLRFGDTINAALLFDDADERVFVRHGAVQCGFCTGGMIMSASALLAQNSKPSEAEISHALAGNICRCTGYRQIIDAVLDASGQGNTGSGRP